jgi:hypothetical protein
LALYWILWFSLSDEIFSRYKLSYFLIGAVLLAAGGQVYSTSLCDR